MDGNKVFLRMDGNKVFPQMSKKYSEKWQGQMAIRYSKELEKIRYSSEWMLKRYFAKWKKGIL
jgi:hypothetical protein